MKILFNDLAAQNLPLYDKFLSRLEGIFKNSSYILDKNVSEFEDLFSSYSNRKYSVGTSNGTDAIKLCIKSFEPNKNTLVITQANTFVATVIAILDAQPDLALRLVDVDESYQMDMSLLEKLLSEERNSYEDCIVVPVSMYGHTFDKQRLTELKDKYDFSVVEDCSQAHGSKFQDGTLSGTVGDCSAFSLYPGKNLGSIGDAGVANTDSEKIYENLKMIRNYGSKKKYHHDKFGFNHRLDPVQAAFLCEKIKVIDDYNSKRVKVGQNYTERITNPLIKTFNNSSYCSYNTYHIYPVLVEDRERFVSHLDNMGIQNGIHYPIAIEKMPFFEKYKFENPKTLEYCGKLVSLPIHPFMPETDLNYVIEAINNYE